VTPISVVGRGSSIPANTMVDGVPATPCGPAPLPTPTTIKEYEFSPLVHGKYHTASVVLGKLFN
jgi:hypothetical protein